MKSSTNMNMVIAGAGGGGGGGRQRTPVEADDSLQSRAYVTLVDLIGEGQIGGLAGYVNDRAESIFINDTPLRNVDGSYNFGATTSWDFREGTQAQSQFKWAPGVESPHAVGVRILKLVPNVFTISTPNVSSIRVILSVPALFSVDAESGDTSGTSVSFQFSKSIDGGAYVDFGGVQTISGKTRSKYQVQHQVELPSTYSTLSIKTTRITGDSASANLQNDLWIDSYVEINSTRLSYPNSAMALIRVDSSQFSSVPSRSYLVDGVMIRVPSNYNPATNTYTGIWAGVGAWNLASSSNPAWVLYDLLTSKRYGLGDFIDPSQIDTAQLYTIGKYCDELVSDGLGGMEKRFELNTQIAGQKEAYGVISDITSCFRGMMYWAGGLASLTQDSPSTPSMIYGEANVIDGTFNYAGSARKDRHSVILVTYNDPKNLYKQSIEHVEDSELIAKYGIRKSEVIAYGCTSRGQAARVGRWMLYTERYESDLITFGVGPDSALVSPGDVVQINDPQKAGKRMAGRVISATTTSATLDAPVVLAASGATISVRLPDGTFVTRTLIEGAGTFTTVTWVSVLVATPAPSAMFVIAEPSLVPVLARVVSVAEGAKGAGYTISALQHEPTKFTYVETGLKLEPAPTSIVQVVPSVPSNLVLADHVYFSGPSIATMLDISWQDSQTSAQSWDVRVRRTNANWITRNVAVPNAEIPNVTDGDTYYVEVRARNILGNYSAPVVGSRVIVGKTAPPLDVTGLTASVEQFGVRLSWNNNTDLDLARYECRVGGADWNSAAHVGYSASNEYFMPVMGAGTYTTRVKAIDTSGNYSASAANSAFVILAPTAPVVSYSVVGADQILTWTIPTSSFAIDRYEIRYGASYAAGTPLDTTKATTLRRRAGYTGARTYWVAAIDAAGNVGAAGQAGAATITAHSAPASFVGVINSNKYTLTWAAATSGTLPVLRYEIRYGASYAAGTLVAQTVGTTLDIPIDFLGARTYWIAATDTANNLGASASSAVTVSAPGTPAVTTSWSNGVPVVSWAPVAASLPILHYEVTHGAGRTLVGKITASQLQDSVAWVGISSRTYYVKAIDVNNNASAEGAASLSISVAAAPVVTGSLSTVDPTYKLTWTVPAASLPIDFYEVFGAGVSLGRVYATTFSAKVTWAGTRSFSVVATDIFGNLGAAGSTTMAISAPTAPAATSQIVDNNVLLYWTIPTATLPIVSYEIRKGATYGASVLIGTKTGGFTSVFETAAGTYTYWVTGIDSAGNYGTPGSVTAYVSQPPDYVFRAAYVSTFQVGGNAIASTKSNAQTDAGDLILPVNGTETFAAHFTANGWTTPAGQVAAGNPVYIQPAQSPAYYEEVVDYGALIPASRVTVAYLMTEIINNVAHYCDLYTSQDNITYVPYLGQSQVYASQFRYIKLRITATTANNGIARLSNLTISIDSKIKNDAGSATLSIGGAHPQGNIAHDYKDVWTAGMPSGSVPGFGAIGSSAESAIVSRVGPSGSSETVWACLDIDATSDSEGGWDSAAFPMDCSIGNLFAVFVKTTSNNGTTYWGTASGVLDLGGAVNTNPHFWYGDLPALNTWYLVVGYLHPIGYGTTDTNLAGVYNMAGTRVLAGTEFKADSGLTAGTHRAYHHDNTTNSGAEVQFMARPVVIPCTEADAPAKIDYLLRCATNFGASVDFNIPLVDITSVTATATASTPIVSVVDFFDKPRPTRFNVFNFDQTGVSIGGTVGWSAKGY